MEKGIYRICYHTGAGDTTAETLEEAMRIADQGAAYTQQDISIEDADGNEVARRRWCGVEYDEDDEDLYCEDPICFGSFGYYSDWYIY